MPVGGMEAELRIPEQDDEHLLGALQPTDIGLISEHVIHECITVVKSIGLGANRPEFESHLRPCVTFGYHSPHL